MIIMLSAHKKWLKIILLLSHILLASWPCLASSAHGLPCSASLSSSHSICQGMAATGHMEVSSPGVVCDWNGVGLQVVALPLPVLAFGGREGAQKSFHGFDVCPAASSGTVGFLGVLYPGAQCWRELCGPP